MHAPGAPPLDGVNSSTPQENSPGGDVLKTRRFERIFPYSPANGGKLCYSYTCPPTRRLRQ